MSLKANVYVYQMVEMASAKFIVIVDESKVSQ